MRNNISYVSLLFLQDKKIVMISFYGSAFSTIDAFHCEKAPLLRLLFNTESHQPCLFDSVHPKNKYCFVQNFSFMIIVKGVLLSLLLSMINSVIFEVVMR